MCELAGEREVNSVEVEKFCSFTVFRRSRAVAAYLLKPGI